MKKSISLLFALACMFSLSAKTIYLVPDMWNTADAKFSVNYFGGEGVTQAFTDFMTTTDGVHYEATIPDAAQTVIFVRHNSAATAPSWDNKWNQTEDQTLTTANCFTITSWDGGAEKKSTGTWSTYCPPDYGIMVGEDYTAASLNPTPAQEDAVEYMIIGLNLKKDDTFTMYNNCAQQAWVITNIKDGSTTNITIDTEKNTYVVGATGKYDFYFTLALNADAIYIAYTEPTPTEVIDANIPDANAPVYNLLGVQVDSNYRGIVLQNGKKFIQK